MTLAAGYGTRLGELTQSRPKPMLPICGAPLVRCAVLWLRAQGVREIANLLDGRAVLPWAERPVIGVDPTAIIASDVELDARIHVGPGARIGAGAKIGPYTQIGAGAVIEPGVRVERSAVWPGATLEHDLEASVRI